jgi:hypothetical protein
MLSSTTWTMGRILDRVYDTGDRVVVYAGDHAFEGVIRGIGEYLLTLQVDEDLVVVDLTKVSGVKLLGQAKELSAAGEKEPGAHN